MTANNKTDESGQTIKDVCEQLKLSTQSIGVKFRRTFGTGYSVDLVPTDEQYAALFGNIKATRKQPTVNQSGAAKITFEKTGTIATKTHTPKAAPVKKSIAKKVADLGLPTFDTVLRWAIVIFEMGLMCYSMHLFFGSAGILAGIESNLGIRAVTHYGISKADIEEVGKRMKAVYQA